MKNIFIEKDGKIIEITEDLFKAYGKRGWKKSKGVANTNANEKVLTENYQTLIVDIDNANKKKEQLEGEIIELSQQKEELENDVSNLSEQKKELTSNKS